MQVWVTWFPAGEKAHSFIQGFPLEGLDLSARGKTPFHFRIGENEVGQNSCRGAVEAYGHAISWDLRYHSTFRATLSNKGWIGFSRTPHSDAIFSGKINLDGRIFAGDPLGFGVQGHNCGYRHRNFWTWTHAYFARPGQPASTLEALVYEMPLGLVFRKAVLWHDEKKFVFRNLQEICDPRKAMQWRFHCAARNGVRLQAAIDGRGPSVHRVPYIKTDCRGSFEVVNNSLASASLVLETPNAEIVGLDSATGAVLEMVG